jgi:hypothetical protein
MPATKNPRKRAVKKPRSKTAPERTMTALRLSVDQLDQIDRRAAAAGSPRTRDQPT